MTAPSKNVVLDLDNIRDDDQVLDVNTGKVCGNNDASNRDNNDNMSTTALDTARQYKEQGNAAFRNKLYDAAIEHYTQAIRATPGLDEEEILRRRTAWRQQVAAVPPRRRDEKKASDDEKDVDHQTDINNDQKKQSSESAAAKTFVLDPPHPYGSDLAVFYANRAACRMHQSPVQTAAPPQSEWKDEDDDRPEPCHFLTRALHDLDMAVVLHPVYTKAWQRKSTVHERLGDTACALSDALQALQLSASQQSSAQLQQSLQRTVRRLEIVEKERTERLQKETMAKLKDLGNTILGNFGLSLDNFNAVQDPKTGSYSISFDNNNNNDKSDK